MDYQIRREENWETVIDVTVPAERVKPEIDSEFEEYQRSIKLEGFRKGKVPRGLMKKMFGKQIESKVYQPFIAEAWKKIHDENEFHIVGEPDIENIKFDDRDGLVFQIRFSVKPEFDVSGYMDMPVEQPEFKITDEDLDAELKQLRAHNAMIYNIEGEAEEGHFLVTDLQELDRTGLPVIGAKYENQQLQLDEGGELTEQLKGVKAGEERRIVVKNEERNEIENQPEEKYYNVRVKEVKQRVLPALDDDFAKDIGDYKSFKELVKALRTSLEARAAYRGRMMFQNALADELIKRTDIGAPKPMLERYLDVLVSDVRRERKGAIDESEVRDYYRPTAIRNIKWHLISERLADQHDLRVTDDELESRIAEIEKDGEEGAKRASELRGDSKQRENLRDAMQESKIYDFLSRHARVTKVGRPWRSAEGETG